MSNGLDIRIVRKPGLPVLEMQLLVRGGGTLDPPAKCGRASMTAELLDEGTLHHSALEISDAVELLGANFELQAGWDATALALHGLVPRLGPMLDLLAEVVLEPAFPEPEFRRKQEERLHELLQERDEPRIVAVKALARAVFGNDHVYGWPLSGTVPAVQRLRREDLAHYYTSGFAPEHAHLNIVGEVEPDRILREIERRFSVWPAAPTVRPNAGNVPARQRAIYLIDRPGAAQSEVRVGHVGAPRHSSDYFALLLLNTVLGGSFKSRLNMILREQKGFTYGASSAFSFRRHGGLFSASSAVFTDNTAETVSILVHELTNLRDYGITAEELERARSYDALGFVRTFERTDEIAGQLVDLALYDLEDTYLQTYAERIAQVTRDEVAKAASRYLLPEQLSIVVVGDRARILEPLQRLELGPVHRWEAE